MQRALVDLDSWTLLKWLDDPCPFYDWRAAEEGDPVVHPADAHHIPSMSAEFAAGPTARVLRLRANGGGFTPIHVTVNRVELEENTFAGLVSLRLPTEAELAAADFDDVDDAGDGERDPDVDGDNDVESVHHAAGEHGAHGIGDRRRLCARFIGAGCQSGRGGQRGEIGRGLRPMAGDHR